MPDKLVIDGSQGEGGGQILRTSIALAAVTGREIRITNIRAGRPKAGLRPQHLAAVRAAAEVTGAETAGDTVGSKELLFRPGAARAGTYCFDIGTAGSTALLAQTIIPVMMPSSGRWDVTLRGATHNPMAPCFEYLRDTFGVLAGAANFHGYFELIRAGFYPAGGGQVRMQVQGLSGRANVPELHLTSPGELRYIEGVSATAGRLPGQIAERQARRALGRLAGAGHEATIEQASWAADSPGTVVSLRAVFTRSVAGFFALGKKGTPAARVADETVDALLAFLASGAAVDAHAADQLLVIAALAPGESTFTTERITSHLLTNAAVIRHLTGRDVHVDAAKGSPGCVTVPRK